MIHFLVHDAADNVGVAVVDLEPDTDCIGRNLADNSSLKARAEQAIPLGHKVLGPLIRNGVSRPSDFAIPRFVMLKTCGE